MPVVYVRVVRVTVARWLMPVPMRMGLCHRPGVGVLVVYVVNVPVLVLKSFVEMLVLMPLGEMEPEPDCHQNGRTKSSRVAGS